MADNKKKELTTMEAAFIDHLFSDEAKGNIRIAMKMAGYSDNISVTQITKQLRVEITEACQQYIAAQGPAAILANLDVMFNGNQLGAANKLKAAMSVLDRAGLVKPEGDVNLKIPEGGLIILPAKKKKEDSTDESEDT